MLPSHIFKASHKEEVIPVFKEKAKIAPCLVFWGGKVPGVLGLWVLQALSSPQPDTEGQHHVKVSQFA